MPDTKRYNYKKIFGNVLWALLGMSTVVLLGAAINIKNGKCCSGVEINIKGVQNNFFISKNEVDSMLEKLNGNKLTGRTIHSISIAKMEEALQKNPWVKNAELYFDNNEILRVTIIEREPVARIFTKGGSSFYIDSANTILPLSDRFSARVPVFTGFPGTNHMLNKADSSLLNEIKNIGGYILYDPFWMAQIDQVDITDERTFEMIPKIGNNIIVFGNAENYESKFNNLLAFYKQVETKVGWNKYSKINIQYKDQIVAVKRGAEDIIEDSLRAKQIMQTIVANAQKAANDSINNIQLEQSQDDNNIPVATQVEGLPVEIATTKNLIVTPNKTIQPSAEKPNPLPDSNRNKKTIVAVPQKKLPASYEKPFWLKTLNTKTSAANKKLQVKIKPASVERSHPGTWKKTVVPKPVATKPLITNKTINKQVVKPIIKIKAQTPTNDY